MVRRAKGGRCGGVNGELQCTLMDILPHDPVICCFGELLCALIKGLNDLRYGRYLSFTGRSLSNSYPLEETARAIAENSERKTYAYSSPLGQSTHMFAELLHCIYVFLEMSIL